MDAWMDAWMDGMDGMGWDRYIDRLMGRWVDRCAHTILQKQFQQTRCAHSGPWPAVGIPGLNI